MLFSRTRLVARPANPTWYAWHPILLCKVKLVLDLHAIYSVIRQQSLSGIGFLEAGSRGKAPGGVSGVSPDFLSPFAPEGGVPKNLYL